MAKKGSVLVVDDEEIMRDVLETLLSAEGYRVDLAKTGEEGLEAYGRRAYDVTLLDVSMPGIGGLRALEELLKLDEDAVVLMITAYATFDTAVARREPPFTVDIGTTVPRSGARGSVGSSLGCSTSILRLSRPRQQCGRGARHPSRATRS